LHNTHLHITAVIPQLYSRLHVSLPVLTHPYACPPLQTQQARYYPHTTLYLSVRMGAQPVQRGRQGPHQLGGDRRSGDEARHLEDAHDRNCGGPLRVHVVSGRVLRQRDEYGVVWYAHGGDPV